MTRNADATTALANELREVADALATTEGLVSSPVSAHQPRDARWSTSQAWDTLLGAATDLPDRLLVGQLAEDPWSNRTDPAEELARQIRRLARRPTDLVLELPEHLKAIADGASSRTVVDYVVLTRITAAVREILEERAPVDADARLAAPKAALAEALLRTAPFRVAVSQPDRAAGMVRALRRHDRLETYAWHARRARERFIGVLNALEGAPLLDVDHADPSADLVRMFVTDDGHAVLLQPEELDVGSSGGRPDPPAVVDRYARLAQDVCADHLLLRSDMASTHRIRRATHLQRSGGGARAPWSWRLQMPELWMAGTALALAAALLLGGALQLAAGVAAGVAVLGYAVMLVITLKWDPDVPLLWALRMPAASMVGFAVLVALPGGIGAVDAGPAAVAWASLGAAGAAAGILLLETSMHAPRGRGLQRGIRALWMSAGHGIVVVTVALATFMPVAAAPRTVAALHGLQGWRALLTVVFLAFSSVATGLLLQTLWDDEPVMAPLGHHRWR